MLIFSKVWIVFLPILLAAQVFDIDITSFLVYLKNYISFLKLITWFLLILSFFFIYNNNWLFTITYILSLFLIIWSKIFSIIKYYSLLKSKIL